MPKKANSKLKLLYMKQILEKHTDEDHGISREEIIRYLSHHGIDRPDRKTVYDDIETLQAYGMDIEHNPRAKSYRLLSRQFDLAEIKMLIDSTLSSKFLSAKKTSDLIEKLKGFCSEYEAKELDREVVVANRVKTMNQSIHYNVDGIHRAIAGDYQVQFRYFDYDIRKNKKYFKKGEMYVVSPWKLLYTDDNYYLLAYDEPAGKFKHFRVDKMDTLSAVMDEGDVPRPRIGKEAFDDLKIENYTKYTFSMYGGEVQNVEMVFQNRMMGAVMDRFGRDIVVFKVDNNHFSTTVPVAVSQQFFGWIFGLGKMVRIVGPESVKAQMRQALADITERYGAE